MSLISNVLVTLDCLDMGVSLDCPQCHTGQGQPSRSKPQSPSFWNQEISAWALKQGGEPRFQAFCFSTPGVFLLCLMGPNVLLLSVLWSGSHLFFSNTVSQLSLTLKAWSLVYIGHVSTHSHSDDLSISPLPVAVLHPVFSKICWHRETFILWWAQQSTSHWLQPALSCVSSTCVAPDN